MQEYSVSDADRVRAGFLAKTRPSPGWPHPGDALEAAIAAQARAGRDVWPAPFGRPVPLLDYTAGSAPGLVNPVWSTGVVDGVLAFARDVPLRWYVEHSGEFLRVSNRLERNYTYAQIRQLIDAYDVDILGHGDHWSSDGDDGPRRLRERVQFGRCLYAQAGRWPWAVFGPDGRPPVPKRWWQDELAAIAWRRWLGVT
jgi:hypothetical protein